MCRVLEASTSGHYAWRSRPGSPRPAENRILVGEIERMQARHRGRYGSARIRAALRVEGHLAQLAAVGAASSISCSACCYDNAPMESFLHRLKVELIQQQRWAIRDQARRDLFASIEGYSNRARMHAALG